MAEEKASIRPAQPTSAAAVIPPSQTAAPVKSAYDTADPTNVSLWLSAMIGLGITVGFYVVLFAIKGLAVTQGFVVLFTQRTYVVHATVLLTAWAVVILLLKWRKLQRQREIVQLDVLPIKLAPQIDTQNAEKFLKHMATLPYKRHDSFLLDRLSRALEHFRARSSVQETVGLVTAQGDIDAMVVSSSYGMLNVLAWAVPILGFIGTVYGISGAVSGFSGALDTATDFTAVKDGLKVVTSGLAVAFDTTLIALVLSLLIVFPARALQKAEEDLLSTVDDYCMLKLMPRMKDTIQQQDQSKEWVKNAVAAAMASQEAEFKLWTQHLEKAGAAVSQQVVDGWAAVNQQLATSQGKQVEGIQAAVAAIAAERTEFVEQIKSVQTAQVEKLNGVVTSVSETAANVSQQMAELQAGQARSFKDVVGELAGNLRALQDDAQTRHQAEAGVLQNMATGFAGTLQQMQEQAGAMQTGWSKQIEVAATAVTQHVAAGWETINARLQQAYEAQVKELGDTAGRIQAQLGELQQAHIQSMKESVSTISTDLKTIQQQTGAAQLESSKHFESLSSAVTTQVVEGWEKIDAKLRARTEGELQALQEVIRAMTEERKQFVEQVKGVQDHQVQQFSAAASTFERLAARVQEQVGALQEKQVRELKDSVSTISAEVRTAREQGMQQFKADADNLQRMVTAFSETLRGLREQVGSMQREVGEHLRGSGSAVREELRELTSEIGDAFRQQIQALEQVQHTGEESAEKFASNLEKMRSVHAESLSETVKVLRENTRSIQQDIATGQDESVRKLQEIASTLAEHGRTSHREIEAAREALAEASRQLAQQGDKVRETTDKAARSQLAELSATAERVIHSLGEGLKAIQEKLASVETSRQEASGRQLETLRQEREAISRTATEHLAKVTSVGNELVAAIAESQRKLAEQMGQIGSVMQDITKLDKVQEKLAANLQLLATSDSFKATLSGIDRGLNHLHPVLKDLSDRAGIKWEEPGSDGNRGSGRKWRLFGGNR